MLAVLLAGLALTGCASASPSGASGASGSGTAGRASNGSGSAGPGMNGSGMDGSGMMGGGSGYSYSRLTCAAPSPLPGRTVTVMLADMGMTQMMGGTAPLGARMMLRAVPATVPAAESAWWHATRGGGPTSW